MLCTYWSTCSAENQSLLVVGVATLFPVRTSRNTANVDLQKDPQEDPTWQTRFVVGLFGHASLIFVGSFFFLQVSIF